MKNIFILITATLMTLTIMLILYFGVMINYGR